MTNDEAKYATDQEILDHIENDPECSLTTIREIIIRVMKFMIESKKKPSVQKIMGECEIKGPNNSSIKLGGDGSITFTT